MTSSSRRSGVGLNGSSASSSASPISDFRIRIADFQISRSQISDLRFQISDLRLQMALPSNLKSEVTIWNFPQPRSKACFCSSSARAAPSSASISLPAPSKTHWRKTHSPWEFIDSLIAKFFWATSISCAGEVSNSASVGSPTPDNSADFGLPVVSEGHPAAPPDQDEVPAEKPQAQRPARRWR